MDGRVLTGDAGVARNLGQCLPTARGGSALPRKALAQVKRLCENDPIRTRDQDPRDTS
jgi:hypothetical protein